MQLEKHVRFKFDDVHTQFTEVRHKFKNIELEFTEFKKRINDTNERFKSLHKSIENVKDKVAKEMHEFTNGINKNLDKSKETFDYMNNKII